MIRIIKKIRYFLLILLTQLITVSLAFGQVDQSTDKNHNEQVTIIGSFDPSINEAYKSNHPANTQKRGCG